MEGTHGVACGKYTGTAAKRYQRAIRHYSEQEIGESFRAYLDFCVKHRVMVTISGFVHYTAEKRGDPIP